MGCKVVGSEVLMEKILVTAAFLAVWAGGLGTRAAVNDRTLLDWLKGFPTANPKPLTFIASVCTGSAILAKAGNDFVQHQSTIFGFCLCSA